MLTLAASPISGAESERVILALRGRDGPAHVDEPVTIGIPFPRGRYKRLDALGVADGSGRPLPCQWDIRARWSDGSVRWGLLDFVVNAEAGVPPVFTVIEGTRAATPVLDVQHGDTGVVIHTGAATFEISSEDVRLTGCLTDTRAKLDARLELAGKDGAAASPRAGRVRVEATGPVRATIAASGELRVGRRHTVAVESRLSFFAGTGLVLADLTLRNPRRARHRGGLWDLGDSGSALFRAFTWRLTVLPNASRAHVSWTTAADISATSATGGPIKIYQASSGGANWQYRTHMNREGQVPLAFRGFRVQTPEGTAEGLRANPVVTLSTDDMRLSAAIDQFWQNFPKGIETDCRGMTLALFPAPFEDVHELLGGEQKTHRIWFRIESGGNYRDSQALAWVHAPLLLAPDPEWFEVCRVAPGLVSADDYPILERRTLLVEALEGPTSFFAKREVIDEYGWRNFGDVYADHENAHFEGQHPVVSHFNNQYDLVGGFLSQFLRTGEARWFELGRDLARHVIDIDLYHTTADRPAYNGGMFWHTDHYADAHRATHRSYSRDNPRAKAGRVYGGGPSNEHNYTSGLVLYHYLTGSIQARDAVLSLGRWVVDMDDGRRTALGVIDPGPTGRASATASPDYHGPGRGAGNSVSALLDAFTLSGERHYLDKAEELIRRVVHPADDIPSHNLDNPERRWSYLVFLQALGKYLDLKVELLERDRCWAYARASLVAYARWMLDHEVPYAEVLDRVEFPTETWPAHDLRKAIVFGYAVRYGPDSERDRFLEAQAHYRDAGFTDLFAFESRTATRPLAIVLQNGIWDPVAGDAPEPSPVTGADDFGMPGRFEPQATRVARLLRSPRGLGRVATRLARPDRLLAFVSRAAIELLERWP